MFCRMQGVQLGLEHCRNPFDPPPEMVGQHSLVVITSAAA
jgi:hypothetical protein